MQFLRKWIRTLLGFSGRETNGFLILLPLILIIIFSEPVYRLWIINHSYPVSDKHFLDSMVAIWPKKDTEVREISSLKQQKFKFDPNTASVEKLIALGFSEKLAKRVDTYRQKGGSFEKPSDLGKLYGIDSAFLKSLIPYVSIAKKAEQSAKQPAKATFQSEKNLLTRFNINEADTATLEGVYGIGTKLAERILKFRAGLGGFVRMDQLSEVYGLDSAVVNRLKKKSFIADGFEPKKLNLNTTTESEMSAHPYISKSAAKAIVAWRFQHGAYKSVDELKNVRILKPEDIIKIVPYLTVEE